MTYKYLTDENGVIDRDAILLINEERVSTVPKNIENSDWQAYQQWLLEGNHPSPFYNLNGMAEAALERKLNEMRQKRNSLLTLSDWTQLVDSPLNAASKLEWREYRQALRDLPEQSGDPDNIIWPTAP